MSPRLTRAEQGERNRALVLSAARQVFLARGYHAATLDQIADAAGFSKGVVYSQFHGKADLFLELLEARIEERARENAQVVAQAGDRPGLPVLLEHLVRTDHATVGWLLLVAEFRVHAARDPELSQRYAAVHARTVEALASVLAAVSERAGQEFAFPPRAMAEVMLAISTGSVLEQAANPDAVGGPMMASLLARLLGPAVSGAPSAPAAARPAARPVPAAGPDGSGQR
jgi:AcrR family transcriptional regulator